MRDRDARERCVCEGSGTREIDFQRIANRLRTREMVFPSLMKYRYSMGLSRRKRMAVRHSIGVSTPCSNSTACSCIWFPFRELVDNKGRKELFSTTIHYKRTKLIGVPAYPHRLVDIRGDHHFEPDDTLHCSAARGVSVLPYNRFLPPLTPFASVSALLDRVGR